MYEDVSHDQNVHMYTGLYLKCMPTVGDRVSLSMHCILYAADEGLRGQNVLQSFH